MRYTDFDEEIPEVSDLGTEELIRELDRRGYIATLDGEHPPKWSSPAACQRDYAAAMRTRYNDGMWLANLKEGA
jgi:hypothetical protein